MGERRKYSYLQSVLLELSITCAWLALIAEIKALTWSEVPGGFLLLVHRGDAPNLSFVGFRESDFEKLKSSGIGSIEQKTFALSGHNWGKLSVDGASLVFQVDSKQSFILPLPDVAQAQQGRDEVMLQFPVDDTTGSHREDSLVEVTFHVPKDCSDFPPPKIEGNGEADGINGTENGAVPLSATSSKVLFDLVNSYTDAGAAAGDAIVTFDSVGILVPRGRFDVEMYATSLKLIGQAQDFRVQYDSILRVFILPKMSTNQTLVAVCLDPPIRKGQTFYNTILCQFHNDEEVDVELALGDDALAARNEKGARLSRGMHGPFPDIFAKVLRGLSGAKLTRPGAFRDASGEGFAVRCSFKADDGYLYPLERAFFYVQKPPLLMPYDDVESVEFMRQSSGITAAKTFDLAVRMKSGQDHLFRSIPRSEWTNLFEWIQAKQLRIDNFKEAQRGPGAGPMSYADDIVDPGLAGIDAGASSDEYDGDDNDEEDEDFEAAEISSEEDSGDDSDTGMVDEDALGHSSQKKRKESGDKTGKKQKRKKDKNAPKKAISAFMYFSNENRDKIKEENPGIAFGDVGKKLGDLWKSMSPEEKAQYEAKAEEDKVRYQKEMEDYVNKQNQGDSQTPLDA